MLMDYDPRHYERADEGRGLAARAPNIFFDSLPRERPAGDGPQDPSRERADESSGANRTRVDVNPSGLGWLMWRS